MSNVLEYLLLKGWGFYERGDYGGTIRCYEEALALDPENVEVLNYLGDAYLQIGNPAKALEVLQKAVRLDPSSTNPVLHTRLGYAYYRTGQYRRAIDEYRQAIRLGSNETWLHAALADAYAELGEVEKIRESLGILKQIEPENPAVYFHQGNLAYGRKNYEEALVCYEAALAGYEEAGTKDSDKAKVMYAIGNALLGLDRNIEAKEALQKAGDKGFASHFYSLGVAEYRLGHIDEAINCYKQAVRNDPYNFDAYQALRAIYRHEGRRGEARRISAKWLIALLRWIPIFLKNR